MVGASVVGTSHLARKSVCQDAHACQVLGDGTLVIAVADGAGSAARSAEGAECASRTAVEFLAAAIEAECDGEALESHVQRAIQAASNALDGLVTDGSSRKDFSTTLLLAVVTHSYLAIGQVGDGAIVAQRGDALEVLTRNDNGEYVNQTTFLTSSDYLDRVYVTSTPVDGIRALAALTDGIQLLSVHHRTNVALETFFRPMFQFAADPTSTNEAVAEFLSSDAVSRRTDDDKTLVLSVRI